MPAADYSSLPLPLPGTNAAAAALPSVAAIPTGRHTYGGVPFEMSSPWLVTGLDDARNGDYNPPRSARLPVGRKADRVHLLFGAHHDDKIGVPIVSVVFHYADGSERSSRLAYGVHALSWVKERNERHVTLIDPESKLAWASAEETDRSGSLLRLFQTVIDNPRPAEPIESLEWVSLFSRATPFLTGVTLEREPPAGRRRPAVARRAVRKSTELKDSSYVDFLQLKVLDEASGQPLPEATAALNISDDEGEFFFGTAQAEAGGTIRLAVPPQQMVGYAVAVRASRHLPALLRRSITNSPGGFLQLEVRLAAGVKIGGLVRDPGGRPMAGAQVVVHHVSQTGPREYERVDHDVVRTGADGRWTSETVPAGFTNLAFQVSHSDQRTAWFRQGETNRPGALTREALLAGSAVMDLPPPLRITGTVTDNAGAPVAKAQVRWRLGGQPEHPVPCDAQGRFSFVADQPGDCSLVVQAPGFGTRAQSVRAEPGMAPIAVRLAKAQPFRGVVFDQYQTPVAGAKVRYEPSGGPRTFSWQTVTDQEGKFVWESPPDSDLMFYITASNHSSMRMSFSGTAPEHRIQLRKQSRIYGTVIDAESRKPLDEFQIIRGRSYNYDEPIRWDRYDPMRGRKGEFSVRLDEYSSSGRSQVLVEAPGYMPQASPPFTKAGIYTNLFVLIKGRGISGMVVNSDGTPAAAATVALVDPGESVEMDRSGELRRGNSGPAFQRSNAAGRFEFQPKYDAHTLVAANEQGYGQITVSNLLASGKVVLQAWGRVEGTARVGREPVPGRSIMLQSSDVRFAEEGRTYPALRLNLRADPDADNRFVFEKVPSGERSVCLQYKLGDRESSGRIATSHNTPVTVAPNATATVLIGGTGRSIRGKVIPVGADAEDLDWHRDVNQMSSVMSLPPSLSSPVFTPSMTEPERQKAMQDLNSRQAAFWRTPEGRAIQSQQHQYYLLFDTNGAFHVDNVEAGQYWIYVHITNPDRGPNYYETIGSQSFQVTVPAPSADGASAPFEVGEFKLPVRGLMRLGRVAPQFEATSFDGKPVKLVDFKGKYVLLDFWATWAGSRSYDARMLKEVYDAYGKDPRFVLIGLNFDQDRALAERAVQEAGFKWTQCYMGGWDSTGLPASFGVQGLPEGLLVDPQGKIAARNLRGSNLRTTVRNFLSQGGGATDP